MKKFRTPVPEGYLRSRLDARQPLGLEPRCDLDLGMHARTPAAHTHTHSPCTHLPQLITFQYRRWFVVLYTESITVVWQLRPCAEGCGVWCAWQPWMVAAKLPLLCVGAAPLAG